MSSIFRRLSQSRSSTAPVVSPSRITPFQENLKTIDDFLISDDVLSVVFSFLLPEELFFVSQVSKRWSRVSSFDVIWIRFCSTHWADDEKIMKPILWKKLYVDWIRRMGNHLRDVQSANRRTASNKTSGSMKSDSISFFWPSFSAFRERFSVKFLIIGERSVGKTALLRRFTEGTFLANPPLSKRELKFHTIEIDGQPIEMQIMETDFNELRPTRQKYIPHACFLCYDMSDLATFTSARKSIRYIQRYSSIVLCFLVGTKADISLKRSSSADATKSFEAIAVPMFETSAKENININECFYNCAKVVFRTFMWPRYVPPEDVLRKRARVDELRDPPPHSPQEDPNKCAIQ